MIEISGSPFNPSVIMNDFMPNSIESHILNTLSNSSERYSYDSVEQLKFELSLRRSIVNAAIALNRSRFSFRIFTKSKCNPEFWHRTNEGGFLLENGVKASDAINDIYINSHSYGTECATAMVIVYYKALVDLLPEGLFNRLFPHIYLMNWQHLDPDLGIVDHIRVADYLPGDGRYFRNPDVNPMTPEWQGENVIDLGNGRYYGHGIGIASAEFIIEALNKERIHGSTVSARLLGSVKRPDFKGLANKFFSYTADSSPVPVAQ